MLLEYIEVICSEFWTNENITHGNVIYYCILLMQVVGDNKWSIVSSVGHTFICAYQRAADGHLDSL